MVQQGWIETEPTKICRSAPQAQLCVENRHTPGQSLVAKELCGGDGWGHSSPAVPQISAAAAFYGGSSDPGMRGDAQLARHLNLSATAAPADGRSSRSCSPASSQDPTISRKTSGLPRPRDGTSGRMSPFTPARGRLGLIGSDATKCSVLASVTDWTPVTHPPSPPLFVHDAGPPKYRAWADMCSVALLSWLDTLAIPWRDGSERKRSS